MLLGTIYTILLLYLVSGFIFRFVSVVKHHWILPDSAETQLLEKFQKFSSTFPQTSPQRKKIFYHVFVTHNSGTSPEASQVNGGHVLEPGPAPALLEHHQLARHPPTEQSQQRWTFWNQNQPSDRRLLCDLTAIKSHTYQIYPMLTLLKRIPSLTPWPTPSQPSWSRLRPWIWLWPKSKIKIVM